MARRHQLKRSDVRHEIDKPTRSVILRYVGSTLEFDEYIYGYPDDTFFAELLDEMPWPEELEELSQRLGIAIDPLPDAPRLRTAVADALAAGAMVDAPLYMDSVGVDRDVEWPPWERRELERRHRIAEARVSELVRYMASDMRLRASGITKPKFDAGPGPAPAPAPEPVVIATFPTSSCEEAEDRDEDEGAYDPRSRTVHRARQALEEARAQELPQRLPGGMRRRLRQAPPAVYILYGETMDPRLDLCAAMTDGRSMGRADREISVVDYDGEWPVVVRRYGQDGRTIYKVEDALRRYGIDVPEAP